MVRWIKNFFYGKPKCKGMFSCDISVYEGVRTREFATRTAEYFLYKYHNGSYYITYQPPVWWAARGLNNAEYYFQSKGLLD